MLLNIDFFPKMWYDINKWLVRTNLRPVTAGADIICPKSPVNSVHYTALYAKIYNKNSYPREENYVQ